MANLYLIDRPAGKEALSLAGQDKGAAVVLLQDGVYLDPTPAMRAGAQVYAVKPDVDKRGLGGKLPPFVKQIDYKELVDLIFGNKVINLA